LGLKNSGGGSGGGAITCFEDTGSPAKMATACDAIARTAKTIIFFIWSVLTLLLA
jgi:hypothetical protein